ADGDLAARLGAAARARAVAELSWARAARRIEAIYAEALARRRRPGPAPRQAPDDAPARPRLPGD
ncbi:MAG TPA: glycosyltransferase family 1 protein, partial [Chloroflexaceae bacterium]|nr:glycosyltransferase family 1 protein [Chloroflexaceae bacterium]